MTREGSWLLRIGDVSKHDWIDNDQYVISDCREKNEVLLIEGISFASSSHTHFEALGY